MQQAEGGSLYAASPALAVAKERKAQSETLLPS